MNDYETQYQTWEKKAEEYLRLVKDEDHHIKIFRKIKCEFLQKVF